MRRYLSLYLDLPLSAFTTNSGVIVAWYQTPILFFTVSYWTSKVRLTSLARLVLNCRGSTIKGQIEGGYTDSMGVAIVLWRRGYLILGDPSIHFNDWSNLPSPCISQSEGGNYELSKNDRTHFALVPLCRGC